METAESRIFSVQPVRGPRLIATSAALVQEWKGRVDTAPTSHHSLPAILHDFYSRLGGSLDLLCVQNTILPLDELEVIDDRLVFARENQGVFAWSVEPNLDDPPVFYRYSGDESWSPDVPHLSQFLLQFTIFELLMGAPLGASASWLTGEELRVVTAGLRELSYPEWNCPARPGRFFVRGNALAFACPNRGPSDCPGEGPGQPWSFWFGANDSDGADFLRGLTSPEWEYVALQSSG